jgi:tripartite-type tricarboxylate transporter receptor subunit TctC
MRRIVMRFTTAIAAAALPFAVAAQAYPVKPLRVVVPFPPGGVDVTLRLMQNVMTTELGQPLVIENRVGANGYIGTENVARSAPDGYSLLATSIAVVAGPPVMKAPYDPVKDLTAITQFINTVAAVVVKPSLPVSSIQELIDYAKKNPGKLSYGTSGIGSAQHIDGELFKLLTGTDIVHVPYKGGGPQLQAIAAQEVDLSYFPMQQIRPLIDSHKAKIIAVYDDRRYSEMPNVPSINETVPQFRRTPGWVGLFGPAGLPAPIVNRVSAAAVKALRTPDVKAKIEETAMVVANTPEEFGKVVREDYERISRTVAELRSRGVKFE